MDAAERTLLQLMVGLVALALVAGCGGDREERKIIIREEQHEGEVQEVSPGEMIVE